jgi:hypothetical protein
MSSYLFVGGKFNSIVVESGTIAESSSAGFRDATYCDSALSLVGNASGIGYVSFRTNAAIPALRTVVAGETVWAHVSAYYANVHTTNKNILWLADASGQPWLAIRLNGSGAPGLYYNSGTGAVPAWTQIGSSFTIAQAVLLNIDLVCTIGAGGTHEGVVYVANVEVARGNFTQASLTGLQRFYFGPNQTNTGISYYSQILVTEGRSTVNANVKYTTATGAGTTNTMTGSATDINEAVGSDATVLQSGTAGQKATFAWGDVTVLATQVIGDVWLWYRAKNDGVAPQNIKSVTRSGGVDTASANLSGIGTGFSAIPYRVALDGTVGATVLTQAGFNACEFGVESAT